MKPRSRYYFGSILLVAFLMFMLVLFLGSNKPDSDQPTVQNGNLDLPKWDFTQQGNLKLDGEWAFYWKQYLLPGEFESSKAHLTGYYPVPRYWTKYEGLDLPSKGYATYRVVVDTAIVFDVLSIKVAEIYTDYSLYINGEKIYSHGSFNGELPEYLKPDVYTFSNRTNKIEIVLQVKNESHFNAGVGGSFSIGLPEAINRERNVRLAKDLIILTICLTAGFYHVILFVFRRKDYRLLLFSILCAIAVARDLFANETYIMQIFPHLPFWLGSKIVHSQIPLMAMCIIIYTYLTYKNEIPKKTVISIIGISIAYLIFVLSMHSYLYTMLANYYFLVFCLAIIIMTYSVLMKYKKGSKDALIFAFGVLSLLLGVMNDMLYYHKVLHTGYMFSSALTVFIISQSILLSKEYSDLIREKGKLYKQLTETTVSFMQAQIKPHFIYNALSTISHLSTKDPYKAKELILDFSDYLRGSFEFNDPNGLTVLSKELNLVKAYLAIEKERYGDRLTIDYNITEDQYTMIPHFCIQPLVENAIKHGIMNKVEGGKVSISALRLEDSTHIIIQDNGVGMSEEKIADLLRDTEKGVGIRNINNRLKLKYGKDLTIESKIDVGTKIEMVIPRHNDTEGGREHADFSR